VRETGKFKKDNTENQINDQKQRFSKRQSKIDKELDAWDDEIKLI